ncbi:hypothetical protein ACP70R_003127 [Stipagrostis hirtigluma subsp. patula]
MAPSKGLVTTTASTSAPETARGWHAFKVAGYSLHRGLGAGRYIRSATFFVGGHGWSLRYYPDGHAGVENRPFVSVYLELVATKRSVDEVRAVYILRLRDQLTGASKVIFNPVTPSTFSRATPAWGARCMVQAEDRAGAWRRRASCSTTAS